MTGNDKDRFLSEDDDGDRDEGFEETGAPEGVPASGHESDDAEEQSAPQTEGESQDAGETEASDDELTVDDILSAPQSDEAAVAEAPEEEHDLLIDLKRLQAEYANYRRRTEEQRALEIQRAKGEVVKGLLPVLDDLDRADQHGDLEDGTAFAVIGEKVRTVVERMGVEKYGAAGEPFDPQHHEAILQQPTPGTEQPTILEVVEVGYRLGDVELRPAKVVVAVPAE